MKYYVSEPGCASVFRQMKAPNLVEPLDRHTLIQWAPQFSGLPDQKLHDAVNLLR